MGWDRMGMGANEIQECEMLMESGRGKRARVNQDNTQGHGRHLAPNLR